MHRLTYLYDPDQAVVEMDDSDDEEVRKAKCEKGPKRSVALKIAARRVLDSDPPELPMAKHKVQGLHGLEHYELLPLAESVTVDTMLQHRRQRELKDRLKRSEPEKKRLPETSASRSLSWEERQEQVEPGPPGILSLELGKGPRRESG
eukprot:s605_g31.t1